jgi:hypothetical protein
LSPSPLIYLRSRKTLNYLEQLRCTEKVENVLLQGYWHYFKWFILGWFFNLNNNWIYKLNKDSNFSEGTEVQWVYSHFVLKYQKSTFIFSVTPERTTVSLWEISKNYTQHIFVFHVYAIPFTDIVQYFTIQKSDNFKY